MGKVETICISTAKGKKKTPVDSARFVENHGIEGDAHAGSWHRQISLLSMDDIQSIREEKLPNLSDGDFAENIILSGLPLSSLGLGSVIQLGDEVQLAITQLGKTCHNPCEIHHQTGDCIMPRVGLFARVIAGGTVTPENEAKIISEVPRDALQVAVLTISDRCSRGETEDTAGPAVCELVKTSMNAHIYSLEIVPDKQDVIADRLLHFARGHSIDLILTVGGTGFAPSDVTPEAVAQVIERPTPGLDEAMRTASAKITPRAMLSRAVSGIRESTLIISLPGSERSSTENLEAVLPALEHGLEKLRGDPSDCGR
jgi:molybdopterin adenylyltransferase